MALSQVTTVDVSLDGIDGSKIELEAENEEEFGFAEQYGDLKCMIPAFLLVAACHLVVRFALPQHTQVVPEGLFVDGGATLNPTVSYPVAFSLPQGRVTCALAELLVCNATAPSTACCAAALSGETVHETISTLVLLLVFMILVPILLLVFASCVLLQTPTAANAAEKWALKGQHLKVASFGWVMTGLVAALVVEIFKRLVGRPRPIYYCLQRLFDLNPTAYAAFNDDKVRSFPSGHASGSVSTLFFCSLVLADTFKRTNFYKEFLPVRSVLMAFSFAPAFLGFWVACTRIIDYFHHVGDVVCGVVIAGTVAALVFGHLQGSLHTARLRSL